ncbi:hypothetical protein KTJ89_01235 [Brevibacterium sediminis]|uniref:Uncharacterized protein n=1 Tax=Brevibacterium sediminis TaxID=1857024 RepID=A0A5C4X588_9MICO|nr:hypothetical protein [Brevibacterium sediminis]MCS4591619.1 hypothetical protein [Brevibacterium sediminis]TNM57779.1 hypothetical protein FHQ09_00285 [Brevibacterium sediminis]GGC23343.1 hypothetical protein GCM10010974_02480 [Brevibacterium sediminis]
MHSGTDVKPFTPSDHWLNDWPFDVWTVVQVRASITGAAAERAVRTFQAALRPDPDADVAEGTEVHFWGGYTAETSPSTGRIGWQIVLKSSGQDGISSVIGATDDLVEAIRQTSGEVRLTWHEVAASRAEGH